MPIKDLNAFMRTMSVDAALNALAAHFNNGPPEEDVLFCPGPPPTCGGLLPVAVDLAGRLWRYDVNESQLVMFHDHRANSHTFKFSQLPPTFKYETRQVAVELRDLIKKLEHSVEGVAPVLAGSNAIARLEGIIERLDPFATPPEDTPGGKGWPADRLDALEKLVLDAANKVKCLIDVSPGAQAHIDRERHRAAGGKSG